MLLINNEIVARILDMKGCIEALETGYRDLINERASTEQYDLTSPTIPN
jgi:hypothetical protein